MRHSKNTISPAVCRFESPSGGARQRRAMLLLVGPGGLRAVSYPTNSRRPAVGPILSTLSGSRVPGSPLPKGWVTRPRWRALKSRPLWTPFSRGECLRYPLALVRSYWGARPRLQEDRRCCCTVGPSPMVLGRSGSLRASWSCHAFASRFALVCT